ncbi:sugar ABC transporter permease [Mesoplasma seiffertii]|uniref:sugar ABC transporter permease n=1 Tax=Mesoplasma seiffertii TaxID=28224 RepID=UPI0006877350|nr:sugar ABC transporter permease [Mesoplasma seiffertii]
MNDKHQINHQTNLFNNRKQPLDFDILLRPVKKYSNNDFKKNYWSILKKTIFKNDLIAVTEKVSEYKIFVKNNYMFGSIVDIFKKISIATDNENLSQSFLLLLLANAFSKFDDKLNFEINSANEVMNKIAMLKIYENNILTEQKFNWYQENESMKDINYFGFKNFESYEFKYQWKRLNAIIVNFFELINKKSIGKIIAKIFLLSYEAQREISDFTSTSLVVHENLSEDFIFNNINILLKMLFNELKTTDVSDDNIKQVISHILGIVTEYQIKEHKDSLLKRFIRKKRSKEKFRLYISKEINDNIAKELRYLTNRDLLNIGRKNIVKKTSNFNHPSVIKINGKVIRINPKALSNAKFVFKKYDLLDFSTALSETFFKSKHLTFNKYYKHLQIIKMASLAFSYDDNKKNNEARLRSAQMIFEILIMKLAFEININFGETIKKILNNSKLDNIFFVNNKINNINKSHLWAKYICIVKAVFKELQLNADLAEKTIIFEILKNEIYTYESNKKARTIIRTNDVSQNAISKYQNQLIFEIEKQIKEEKINIHIKYIRFMTETFGKLYLSDKPPLTTAGKIGLVATYIVLILWVLMIAVPILQIIIQAFNWFSSNASKGMDGEIGKQGIFDFVNFKFASDNFKYLFNETLFLNWLVNSLVIASICMILMVGITALIGYAFSRFRFKGKRIGLMSVMLIQMIPTVSSFVAFYIMHQLLQNRFGISGQVMLILIYTGGGIPGNVFVLKGYMDNISTDIDDAAKIDGCGNWTIFTRIMLPLAKPMLSVIALWSFIGPFGDVLLPLVLLNDKSQYTMATGLQTLINSGTTVAQGSFAAGSLIVALPISILFLSLQKNITGGLSAAGVKG